MATRNNGKQRQNGRNGRARKNGKQSNTAQQCGNSEKKKHDLSHLAPYQWKPGQSGNPRGRPPGPELLSRVLKKLLDNNALKADQLAQTVVELAVSGDFRYTKELFDRFEGPIKNGLELEAGDELFVGVRKAPIEAIEIGSGNGGKTRRSS